MTIGILQLNKILVASLPVSPGDSTAEKLEATSTSASPVAFVEGKARAWRRGAERLFQKWEAEITEDLRRRSEPSPEQQAIWRDLQALAEDPTYFSGEVVEDLRRRILEELSGYESEASDFPGFKKLRERLESAPRPSPEDYLEVLKLADAGPLWLAVNERIAQLEAQLESAGLTDAIINLPRFWRDEDLELAPAFLEHQTQYIDVHRFLVEGKVQEAYEKFIALEKSHETRFLNEAFEESQTINRCTTQAAIVVASGGMGAIAGRLAGGLALRLGATRGIGLIQFGAMTTTFTVAERGLDHGIRGRDFFDPKKTAGENALEFGESLALNAGMFAFLGAAQKLFAGLAEKYLLAMAAAKAMPGLKLDAKALAPEARAALQAEAAWLRQKPAAELLLKLGAFGTELAAFGAWDFLAANYQLAKEGEWDPVKLFSQTLLSTQAWEERLSFLAALKVGHRLGATVYRGLRDGVRQLKPARTKAASPLAVPKHRVGLSPAGLIVWPEENADLLRLAQAISRETREFPNQRLVLHTQSWATPPALDAPLKKGLQDLAESRGVTIAVKTSAPPYALEFLPRAEAERQQSMGEMRAAPAGEKDIFLWVEETLADLQRSEREAERTWKREHGLEDLEAKLEAAEGGEARIRAELLSLDLKALGETLLRECPPSLRAVYQEPLRRLIALGHEAAWELSHDFARNSLQGLELWHSLAEAGQTRAREGLRHLPLRELRPSFLEESIRPSAYSKAELLRSLAESGNPEALELWMEVTLVEGGSGLAEYLALNHLETGEVAYLEGLRELAERGDPQGVFAAYFLAELGLSAADRILSELKPQALAARAEREIQGLSALTLLAEEGNLLAATATKAAPLYPILETLRYFEGMTPEAGALFFRLVQVENVAALDALKHLERGEEPLLAAAIPRLLRDPDPWLESVRRDFWPHLNDLSPDFLRRALVARSTAPNARHYLKDLEYGSEALPEPLLVAESEIWAKYLGWLRDGKVEDLNFLGNYSPAVALRLTRLSETRSAAHAALLALAAAGHPEALASLPEAPWSGVLEDLGAAYLFPAMRPIEGLIRLRLVELRGRRMGFEVVSSRAEEVPELLSFRLEAGSIDSLRLGKEFHVLERRGDTEGEGGGIDPSSFSMPFMIFGHDAPLTRGLSWLWRKFFPKMEPSAMQDLPETKALAAREPNLGQPIQSDYRELRLGGGSLPGRGVNLAGSLRDAEDHPVFPSELAVHLVAEAGPQPRTRFGEWRVTGYGKHRGRSYLVLERLTSPTAPRPDDPALPPRLFFFSAAPLRLRREAEGETVPLGARVGFLPSVSGGSGAFEAIPSLRLRDLGRGEDYQLRPHSDDEVLVDSMLARLMRAEWIPGDFRRAEELQLTFEVHATFADWVRAKLETAPRARRLVFSLTLAEAQAMGFEVREGGRYIWIPHWDWRLMPLRSPELKSSSHRLDGVAGEIFVLGAGERIPSPPTSLKGPIPLFTSEASEGEVRILGRGPTPLGREAEFLALSDPVVRRRHLILRKRAGGQLEAEALPPSAPWTPSEARLGFYVEHQGRWMKVPPELPFLLHPGQRIALGTLAFQPLNLSQALILRLGEKGDTFWVEP